jgi:Fur family ferric uptake transcriptional regulator
MSGEITHLNQFRDTLHSSGRRMTSKRALVLEILERSDAHLDAETIWQIARKRDPSLNLATVYRTLAVLKEIGLVEQRYFARAHKRELYETVRKPEHYHFTCLGCGQVIEFETARISQARHELKEDRNLHLTHTCVCFEGYCLTCEPSSLIETETG